MRSVVADWLIEADLPASGALGLETWAWQDKAASVAQLLDECRSLDSLAVGASDLGCEIRKHVGCRHLRRDVEAELGALVHAKAARREGLFTPIQLGLEVTGVVVSAFGEIRRDVGDGDPLIELVSFDREAEREHRADVENRRRGEIPAVVGRVVTLLIVAPHADGIQVNRIVGLASVERES